MPFAAGPGEIRFGYGPAGRHNSGGNVYSLDLCQGQGCAEGTIGDSILAPTDMTLVFSGDYNGVPGDALDYHIFEIATDALNRLCLALAHFEITIPGGIGQDQRVPRGAVLGTLLDYGGTFPHIHLGLWTVPIEASCAGGYEQREPLAFAGPYQLDGRDFQPGVDHVGPVTSTNVPVDLTGRELPSPRVAGNDVARTGVMLGPGPAGDPVEHWRYQSRDDYVFSPVVVDNRVYAGGLNPEGGVRVRAFDAATGQERWRLDDVDAEQVSVTGNAEGTVFVTLTPSSTSGREKAAVIAWDTTTNRELWRFVPGAATLGGATLAGSVLYVGGGAFFGDANEGVLYALDADSGAEIWRFDAGADAVYAPAIVDGTVYAGSYNTDGGAALYALAADSGAERWRFRPGGVWHIDSPAVAGGVAYAGSLDYNLDRGGALFAVDAATGGEIWRFSPNLDAVYTPGVKDGMVFAGTFNSQLGAALYALDAATGAERWHMTAEGPLYLMGGSGQSYVASPTIVGDVLYVGTGTWDEGNRGALYALNRADGSRLWRLEVGVDIVYSPTVANGSIYAGSSDTNDGARLLAIGGTSSEG